MTFTVNKAAPGQMRRALLEQVRPAGFSACEIIVDVSLETEPDGGERASGDPGLLRGGRPGLVGF